MNFRILASVLPVTIFFGLTRVAAPWVAILAGFAATAIVTYANRRDRLIGLLAVYGFVIVAICAVVGIVGNNEKAYLISGPVSDFLFFPLYLGSVVLRRPLVGGVARELVPVATLRIPADAFVFMWLSVLWAFYNLSQGFFRLWLLSELSVGEYIILSRLLNWPFTLVMLTITSVAIYREARAHGFRLRDWLEEPRTEAVAAEPRRA